MPSLQKFHAKVASHVKLINKNLCANLIRHEYIVTGRTKAKTAQQHIESFLAKAIQNNKNMKNSSIGNVIRNNVALNYLHPPDREEIGSKLIELTKRYTDRTHGFTRIIKLEPRLGEDRAPMSILELVDGEFEIKFWYTAKIVARLELQGLQIDELTAHNMRKLTQKRPNGEEAFREAVETAKKEFFQYDVSNDEWRKNLSNVPHTQAKGLTTSKKFKTKPRPNLGEFELPRSPFVNSEK